MIEVEPPDVFGYTVFCDDIRVEHDGKITFVGSYSGRMYVNGTFPVTLPKFAISVAFNQAKDAFVAHLKLLVFLPGDKDEASIQGEFGEASDGAILREVGKEPLPEGTGKYIGLTANIVMAPLILKEPGTIAVRVLRSDKFYRVGRLAVLQGAIIAPPSAPSPPA
jgi:hypothetical protein